MVVSIAFSSPESNEVWHVYDRIEPSGDHVESVEQGEYMEPLFRTPDRKCHSAGCDDLLERAKKLQEQ